MVQGDFIFIFDGDCGFCRFWVDRLKKNYPDVRFFPFQEVSDPYRGVPRREFFKKVYLFENSEIYSGAGAIFQTRALHQKKLLWKLYQIFPLFRWCAEGVYFLVSRNRKFFSRLTFFFFRSKIK